MSKFYILAYDAEYIHPHELNNLLKELRNDFPDYKFYTIVHYNHEKGPIQLLSPEIIQIMAR